LRELEALILRVVQPAGNKQIGKLPRPEDLKRKLGRAISEQLTARLRCGC